MATPLRSLRGSRQPAPRTGLGYWGVTAILLSAVVACGGLAGCGSAPAEDAGASSTAVAESGGADGQVEVTLRVAAPVGMQGMIEELADSYAADREWLTFDCEFFSSARKENAAIRPETGAGSSSSTAGASSPLGGVSASSSGSSAAAELVALPQAEIVFQNSLSGMDGAEDEGAVDAATRADMIQDGMVIVTSAQSKAGAVSTSDIEAGSVRLGIVDGKSSHAKRQFEVLKAIGVYADGEFTGPYARAADAVEAFDSTADLFAALEEEDDLVAIVRTSDVYRYGGVKAVGAIPSSMYKAMWYPQAMGANIDALEDGEDVGQAAGDFLSWLETSDTALGIIEKWGFHLAA